MPLNKVFWILDIDEYAKLSFYKYLETIIVFLHSSTHYTEIIIYSINSMNHINYYIGKFIFISFKDNHDNVIRLLQRRQHIIFAINGTLT